MPATMPTPVQTPLPAAKLMTVEEFWDFCHLPENENRSFELEEGRVIEMSRPSPRHGAVCMQIGAHLNAYCFKHSIGIVVINDSGFVVKRKPPTVRGPDVAIYGGLTDIDQVPDHWTDDPPLLAVEIHSPNDRIRKINKKIKEYLDRGVAEVWIVDYHERFMTVHKPNQPSHDLDIADTITSENLPKFRCKVEAFFKVTKPT